MSRILIKQSATLLLLLCCFISQNVQGQKLDKQFNVAEELYTKGKYNEAMMLLDDNLNKEPTHAPSLFLSAKIYQETNDYPSAAKQYRLLVENHPDYEPERSKMFLGLMLKQGAMYEDALQYFLDLKSSLNDSTTVYARKINNEIKACKWILSGKIPRNNSELRALEKLNTVQSEFSTVLLDSTHLLYSRLRGVESLDKEGAKVVSIAIALAEKRKSGWTEVYPLGKELNTPAQFVANPAVGKNQNVLFYSKCATADNCMIFYAQKTTDGDYQAGKRLEGLANLDGSITHPYYFENKKGEAFLYFASNSVTGFGGFDIYLATINKEFTSVSSYKNLGQAINSPGDELTPFYSAADSSLFFSSDWHPGFGGYDIFIAPEKRKYRQGFDTIYNMGYPYNGPSNDVYFSVYPGLQGFLSSNRKEAVIKPGATCCNDIFNFTYEPPLLGKEYFIEKQQGIVAIDTTPVNKVADIFEELRSLIPIQLYFFNDEPDPKSNNPNTDLTYTKAFESYEAKFPDFYNRDENADSLTAYFDKEVRFNYDKLLNFLGELKNIMKYGTEIELTIRGYASPLAKSNYNEILTSRRIKSFTNLIEAYDNGFFLPYLSGEKLKITRLPFGEAKSKKGVSDDLAKKNQSVYSIAASYERRIDLEAVILTSKKAAEYSFTIGNTPNSIDLGKLPHSAEYSTEISLKNPFKTSISIKRFLPSCGCTLILSKGEKLEPGESTKIPLVIDTKGKVGKQHITIKLELKENPAPIYLELNYEVLP